MNEEAKTFEQKLANIVDGFQEVMRDRDFIDLGRLTAAHNYVEATELLDIEFKRKLQDCDWSHLSEWMPGVSQKSSWMHTVARACNQLDDFNRCLCAWYLLMAEESKPTKRIVAPVTNISTFARKGTVQSIE